MRGESVDLLILGAGWTSQFLVPMLEEHGLAYAKTTRQGGLGCIKFTFDPESSDPEPFSRLPVARTILVTFPITVQGGPTRLINSYCATHPRCEPLFIQLGSSGIWKDGESASSNQIWIDRKSPFDASNPRARCEEELLGLDGGAIACTVFNLAGLWGGERRFPNWVSRVAPTKDALKAKKSVHAIHGLDVSQAILAAHREPKLASGQRWLLTDGRVYDWWDLASAWGPVGENNTRVHAEWVRELMQETGTRALPRSPELLGRGLDGRDFWQTFGISPLQARLERSEWKAISPQSNI